MLGQSLRYTAAVLGASIAVALSLLLVHAFGLQGSELLLSLAAVTWVALHTGPAAPRRSPPPCWAGSGPRSRAARRDAERGGGARALRNGRLLIIIAHLGAKVRDSLARR